MVDVKSKINRRDRVMHRRVDLFLGSYRISSDPVGPIIRLVDLGTRAK
mgnify:CR=1 FL=1